MAANTYHGEPQASRTSMSSATYAVARPEMQLPQYFLVRPDTTKHTASGTVTTKGAIVPLIPIDQLPGWLDIVGIPRELSVEQTRGLAHGNLGTVVKDPDYYEIRLHHDVRTAAASAGPNTPDQRKHQRPDPNESRAKILAVARQSSRMDPGAKVFTSTNTSGRAGYHQDSNSSNDDATMANNPSSRQQQRNQSSSSKTSSKSSNDAIATVAYRPRTSKENSKNDHTGTGANRNGSTTKDSSNTIQHLNPRLPSLPPSSKSPANPYPIPHYGPAPPPTHPASRLLNSFEPGNVQYTPTNPTLSNVPYPSRISGNSTGSRKGSHNNGTSKIYCRHWCHHGTCKWDLVCHYEHAMPCTPEGLREVGLADLPAWWKAAMGMAARMGGMGMGTTMGAGLGANRYGSGGAGRTANDFEEMRERWELMMAASNGGSGGVGGARQEIGPRRKGKMPTRRLDKGRLEEDDEADIEEMEEESCRKGQKFDEVETTAEWEETDDEKEIEKIHEENLIDI
ncbi:hypothetical protein BJ170DRAFT_589646 [Xylariales sp. AK1849]|nr:hypothetical protein BJ170DRAFT_589646 [Xylariales sp. AK1849]